MKENKGSLLMSTVFKDWSVLANYENNRLARICILWKEKVRLTLVFKTDQLITCSVLFGWSIREILCGFVYASNFVDERRTLWVDLRSHNDSPLFRNKPWMIYDVCQVLS